MQPRCRVCGEPQVGTARFCGTCGASLAASESESATAPPTGPPVAVRSATPAQPPDQPVAGQLAWIVAGVLAIGAIGALGWFVFFGEGGSGAATPEDAVIEFFEAVNGDDPLRILQSVAPSEVDATTELLETLRDRAAGRALFTLAPGDSSIEFGVDLTRANTAEQADDAALVAIEADLAVSGIEAPGPLDLVVPDSFELDLGRLLGAAGVDELLVGTVREGGGWYVSPVLTAATLARDAAGLPMVDLDTFDGTLEQAITDAGDAIEATIDAADGLGSEVLATVLAAVFGQLLDVIDDASGGGDIDLDGSPAVDAQNYGVVAAEMTGRPTESEWGRSA